MRQWCLSDRLVALTYLAPNYLQNSVGNTLVEMMGDTVVLVMLPSPSPFSFLRGSELLTRMTAL